MAYMNFALEPTSRIAGEWPHAPVAETPAADFSALEWTVISLARHDGAHRPASSWTRRLIAVLIGDDADNPLADPRLEALRRVAIRFWVGQRVLDAEADAFAANGFTTAHFDLLASSIAAGTAANRV
jgi:hypothetical protein